MIFHARAALLGLVCGLLMLGLVTVTGLPKDLVFGTFVGAVVLPGWLSTRLPTRDDDSEPED